MRNYSITRWGALILLFLLSAVTVMSIETVEDRQKRARKKMFVDQYEKAHKEALLFPESSKWIAMMISAAKRGSIEDQLKLGKYYLSGKEVPKDEKQAFYWIDKAAKRGNAIAQEELAFLYFNGVGTPKNANEAVIWGEKSIVTKQGKGSSFSEKMYWILGICYWTGNGCSKDLNKAVFYWKQIAGLNSKAALNVALCYQKGIGVPRDEKLAVEYFVEAITGEDSLAFKCLESYAVQGNDVAQYELGRFYKRMSRHYHDVRKQKYLIESIAYWKKSANNGNQKAQTELRNRGESWN